ncbi:hypothetical protein [Sphingobium cupriresistens]|uniref:hypothetical protein n=1 Tax=Sphingobium cupriresistens TaxID=1132417 RepID=UPI0011E0681D|nr:hypothetical protein [Sphingobium cupriresistens]
MDRLTIHFLAAMFLQTPAWGSESLSFKVARHTLARSVAIAWLNHASPITGKSPKPSIPWDETGLTKRSSYSKNTGTIDWQVALVGQ